MRYIVGCSDWKNGDAAGKNLSVSSVGQSYIEWCREVSGDDDRALGGRNNYTKGMAV